MVELSAMRQPTRPINVCTHRLNICTHLTYMDYYSFTDPGKMERYLIYVCIYLIMYVRCVHIFNLTFHLSGVCK